MTNFTALAISSGADVPNHVGMLAALTLGLTETATQDFLSAASLSFQITVAGYALWLNRVFGTNRAGWALCGAFDLLLAMLLNEAFSPPVTVSALALPSHPERSNANSFRIFKREAALGKICLVLC